MKFQEPISLRGKSWMEESPKHEVRPEVPQNQNVSEVTKYENPEAEAYYRNKWAMLDYQAARWGLS